METKVNEEQLEVFLLERKAQYQSRLREIIDAEITPGNIKSFMAVVFSKLVQLTQDASYDYASTKTVEQGANQTTIEDKAFEFFDLKSISALLDTIEEKRKTLGMIDEYIARSLTRVQSVHTPPDVQEAPESEGEGEMAPHTTRDRLKIVLYILMRDFQLDLANVSLTAGFNAQNMRRKESYVTIEAPELNRILEVCDEVGNRTFVYNLEKVLEFRQTAETLRAMTKQEKRAWLRQYTGSGTSFVEGEHWRDEVALYLSEQGTEELVEREIQSGSKTRVREQIKSLLPPVARGENNPYRNFWTDEEGRHWGSLNAIADRLVGIATRRTFEKKVMSIISRFRVKENALRDASGNVIEIAYLLEDFESNLALKELIRNEKERITKKSVAKKDNETTGDIAGFWRDDDGRHCGSLKRIAFKLGINHGTLRNVISKISGVLVKPKGLRDASGNVIEIAYCLEEVEKLSVVQELMRRAQERKSK